MSSTTDFYYILSELTEMGFPVSEEQRASIVEGITELQVDIKIDSWGCASNGWDEPGEAAEWHIVSTDLGGVKTLAATLTSDQEQWLVNHMQDAVQQYAAESGSEPDYDD